MKSLILNPQQLVGSEGLVLAHTVHEPDNPRKILFRKGHIFSPADADRLLKLDGQELHVIEMDSDDVSEDEAGMAIARAAIRIGADIAGVSEGEVRLRATRRGLFTVDETVLQAFNRHNNVMLWTLQNHVPVEKGDHIASTKIAPLAISRKKLAKAEKAAVEVSLSVVAYQQRRVGVLALERLQGPARARFESGLRLKLAYFGAPSPSFLYPDSAVSPSMAMEQLIGDGTELLLVGGTGATDPADPAIQGVRELQGEIVRNGVPAHPGSTYWLAEVKGVPVLGIASCGMFSKMTALDLILPRFFAGQRISTKMISSLGLGGLIGREQAYRFPKYEGR